MHEAQRAPTKNGCSTLYHVVLTWLTDPWLTPKLESASSGVAGVGPRVLGTPQSPSGHPQLTED